MNKLHFCTLHLTLIQLHQLHETRAWRMLVSDWMSEHISVNLISRAANSHGFAVWHALLHVFTCSHATHPISHAKKKSDFGPRRVRSFSNSPTVDSAKERICNAGFTPGAEAPRRAKESQAPPIHPPVKPLCGSHGLRCAAPRQGLHRWFRRWVYFLRSTRAYHARKHTEKWF